MNSKPLIVVLGATGAQGGSVVNYLLRDQAFRVRGVTRNTESDASKQLKNKGVDLVTADFNNVEELKRAFQGAYGVFGVTNYWQKECMENDGRELQHGKNIVNACKESGVQHLIMSVLDNVDRITDGKMKVEHFTEKGQIEEYMRTVKEIPYKTYVLPSFYLENLYIFNLLQMSPDNKSATVSSSVKDETRVPMFSVEDFGISVSKIFNDKESFNNQRLLIASEFLSFPELTTTVSKVLNIPVKYKCLGEKEAIDKLGEEFAEMCTWFNDYGYFYGDQKQQVQQANKLFPNMQKVEGWASSHKNELLNLKSGKP